jgi:hypothetical protein
VAILGWNFMRQRGFEPPRYCYRQPLKLVRLPVPPLPPADILSRLVATRHAFVGSHSACDSPKPHGVSNRRARWKARARSHVLAFPGCEGYRPKALRMRAKWCQLCRSAWSSMTNCAVTGAPKLSEKGAARSNSSSVKARTAFAAS